MPTVPGRTLLELCLQNGDFHSLVPGQAIDIPLGSHHALGNDTDKPLIVIEVQLGSYFGEDDIVRISDPYRR